MGRITKKTLTEDDLLDLFVEKKKKRLSKRTRFLRVFFSLTFLYITVFAAINYQNLYRQLIYWYRTEYKVEPYAQEIQKLAVKVESGKPVTISVPEISDNHLAVPSINVYAPVTWRVENNDSDVRKNLQNGLIHINGTAMPGEKGNVFVTGHSSDLPWNKGDYKAIFALLDKVVVGDLVQLRYQNKDYIYKVSEIKVVEPSDLSVMESTDKPILTLMTCTPVGTTLRRLVVRANQISPSPDESNKSIQTGKQQKLPKTR
ncbi:MAG: sortase [Patescibacteria group bacterium]|jgi:sortase A